MGKLRHFPGPVAIKKNDGMDHDEGFIFQGVHMLFEGKFDRAWGKLERRDNRVFIGRDLNRDFSQYGVQGVSGLNRV